MLNSRAVPVLFALAVGLLYPPVAAAEEKGEHRATGQPGEERPGDPRTYAGTPDELVPYRRSAEPYRRFFLTPPVFRGPGREKPEPAGLSTVRIGLIAPLEGTADIEAGQSLKRGVELALEEANAAGGYRELPFELVPKNDQALWGASSNTLAELAYADQVWALIGSIDSDSTHVALRATVKAEVVIVNVGSSDPTMTETAIPWIVRCTPDDRQTSYRLARLLFEERGFKRVAVLRSSDRYGRLGVKEFRDAARRLGRPLPMEILLLPGEEDFGAQLERVRQARVQAVVLWMRARVGGLLLRQMRERGMDQPVFGPDRLVSHEFLEAAGAAAEGATATSWMDPTRNDGEWIAFRQRFAERFGAPADAFAAYGYDAANLVVQAVRGAGLNRVRIRDFLTDLRSYRGVAGPVSLDATSNNVSPLVLAVVEGGSFVYR